MPKLIKDGAVVDTPSGQRFLTPAELSGALNENLCVVLQPGETVDLIEPWLKRIAVVAIHFPVFTDGRGFSYARELRDKGFAGEIRATGAFIRDQLYYMQRCGFNAFAFDAETDLEACLSSLQDFSDAYQASSDQPQPLFARR